MRLVKAGISISASRLAVGIAAVALLVSACHVLGTSASGLASGAQITVGVVPSVENAPLHVAAEDGLFRAQGLNVTIKTYSSLGSEIHALTSGQVDIAAGDYADFFYEQANRHASLHLIADGYDATSNLMELLTLPGSTVTTPQDLAGKTVATPEAQAISPFSPGSRTGPCASVPVPYSIETLATESVLQSDGVSPTSVCWKPTPAPNMIGELRSGQVSAILVTEPYILEAESQLGAVELLDSCSGETTDLPLSGYFSLAAYARTQAPAVAAFQSALRTAQADSAMRGPVEAALPSFAGMSAQDAALITVGTYPTFLSVGQVQRVADLMYNSGMISAPLNVSSLVSG
jgi:NitT/TauT family transport system substrate-binding protein